MFSISCILPHTHPRTSYSPNGLCRKMPPNTAAKVHNDPLTQKWEVHYLLLASIVCGSVWIYSLWRLLTNTDGSMRLALWSDFGVKVMPPIQYGYSGDRKGRRGLFQATIDRAIQSNHDNNGMAASAIEVEASFWFNWLATMLPQCHLYSHKCCSQCDLLIQSYPFACYL